MQRRRWPFILPPFDAAAGAIVHASAAPPSTSDSATAALLARPTPCRTEKKTAKDKADGAGNTVPRVTSSLFPYDSDDSDYKAASEDSDSDDAAAALLAKPNPSRGTGKKPSKRKGKDAKNTATMQAEMPPPAKKAKTPTEKVRLLIF